LTSFVPTTLALVMPLRLQYFSAWAALGLFAALALPVVWLGIRNLAAMGPVRQWVAISIRLLVLLAMILILGGLRFQRVNESLEVMAIRDISQSTTLLHDYPGKTLQDSLDDFLTKASDDPRKRPGQDKVGQISFNEEPHVDMLPQETYRTDSRAVRGAGTGTDAAAAIQLALATMSPDSLHRLVLIWDGNSTAGDIESAINSAVAQHVPIDVMPLSYHVQNEVMIESAVAPTVRRENEPFDLSIILKSTNTVPVTGHLSVTHNGELMNLDPYTPGNHPTRTVTLKPGRNVEHVTVPPQSAGVHEFRATIDVDNVTTATGQSVPADTIADNNVANIFTFVHGTGQILYVDNVTVGEQPAPNAGGKVLSDALAAEGIKVDHVTIPQLPTSLVQMQAYDSVILANVPRGSGGITEEQDQMLANYVHDMGGGLVMIGGPETFGAGSWQGSKLEAELPVDMDIPAERQVGKGALVLIMDPAEAPQGSYWGEQCALKAADTLSAYDEIGMIDFDWNHAAGAGGGWNGMGGDVWCVPLGPKGDGSKIANAVKSWTLGDMPSFESSISVALGDKTTYGLLASDAKYKHIVLITDDDPQMPTDATIQKLIANKISVSTVTVYPHNPGQVAQGIKELAAKTGGRSFGPVESGFNTLPQIFIKEAQVIRRSLIQEDEHGLAIAKTLSSSDLVKGISQFPPVYGCVLTQIKHNPLVEEPLVVGPNKDPLLAHWQSGLGRTAVFTSDAYNKWATNWVGSDSFSKFWAQVVRSVSRAPVSTDFDLHTTQDGDKGHIKVEAVNKDNGFLNFVNIAGTIVGPDEKAHDFRLEQTGPGTYEADFDASVPGDYVYMLNYTGEKGASGVLPPGGLAVNGSAELRDLDSNDALLRQIKERTGGRLLEPFDAASADLFSRDGLMITTSPQPIWDKLIPPLLILILLDVAVRRIAWDWLSTQRLIQSAAKQVRMFTQTTRAVESSGTLDSLKRVRGEVAETRFKPDAPAAPGAAAGQTRAAAGTPMARPDPKAKFQGAGVDGDISAVVGGAVDKPVPSSARAKASDDVSNSPATAHTGSLLEAKRRAQQQIKKKENDSP
jgi:uncharacterized membrane protein